YGSGIGGVSITGNPLIDSLLGVVATGLIGSALGMNSQPYGYYPQPYGYSPYGYNAAYPQYGYSPYNYGGGYPQYGYSPYNYGGYPQYGYGGGYAPQYTYNVYRNTRIVRIVRRGDGRNGGGRVVRVSHGPTIFRNPITRH